MLSEAPLRALEKYYSKIIFANFALELNIMIHSKDFIKRQIKYLIQLLEKLIFGKAEFDTMELDEVQDSLVKAVFGIRKDEILTQEIKDLETIIEKIEPSIQADSYKILGFLFYRNQPEKAQYFFKRYLETSKIYDFEIVKLLAKILKEQ